MSINLAIGAAPRHIESEAASGQAAVASASARQPGILLRMSGPLASAAVWAGLAAVFAVILMFGQTPTRQRTLEATVQMERLATMLNRAQVIAPATASKVAELLHQPYYDCSQVTCDAALESRNLMARSRLILVLGPAAFSESAAAGTTATAHGGPAD
jgi:hypothetical protein